jgi:hypothetical protein
LPWYCHAQVDAEAVTFTGMVTPDATAGADAGATV